MATVIVEYNSTVYHIDSENNKVISIGKAIDNDIVLNGMLVENHHATIKTAANGVVIRSEQPTYIDGDICISSVLITKNARLQIGAHNINLHFAGTSNRHLPLNAASWLWLTHPLAVCGWFLLALALILWSDYLQTSVAYIANIRLLLTTALLLLGMTLLLNVILMLASKRNLFVPLLGLISFMSIFSDLCEHAAYWYNFQFDTSKFEILSPLLLILVFLLLFRAFLRDYLPLVGGILNRYTIIFAIPFLLFSIFLFLNNKEFYEHRGRGFPYYDQGILPHSEFFGEAKSIAELLSFKKSN